MIKYSVVIPTLWKSNRTERLLEDLRGSEYVDEIILIDNTLNTVERTDSKIVHILERHNTYVNPAWNKGIQLAKNNCVVLLNDDVNFNPNIFGAINEELLLNTGIIGMAKANYNLIATGQPTLEKIVKRDWGWGCMIFLHKSKWIDIPENIKVWYGDDFIFELNSADKYCLHNFKVETEMSTTSDLPEWNDVKAQDGNNYNRYKQNLNR